MGWNTEKDGKGIKWDFSKSRMPGRNAKLYAQWSIR